MTEYRPPNWRDSFRVYFKGCWMLLEPAFIAIVLLALGAEWWWFLALLILWLPLARIRLRDIRNDWTN